MDRIAVRSRATSTPGLRTAQLTSTVPPMTPVSMLIVAMPNPMSTSSPAQPGQRREDRHGLRGDQAPAVAHFPQRLRSR